MKNKYSDLQKELGIVLSGGGARGITHIGILKVLEKEKINISCISGCSMGGLVGAVYALTNSVNQVEEVFLRHTSLRELINIVDRSPRRRGLIIGKRLRNLISNIIGEKTTFADLKIPLVVNAVDLITSQEITFSEGNLVDAVMSTISIPGFFAPVSIGNYQLIDGGMLNNLPVSNVKIFNPEVVLAVDAHPDIVREKPWQFSSTKPRWAAAVPDYILDFYRAEMIMSYYLTDFFLARFQPDIYIRPKLPSEITTFYGYHHASKLISLGEKAMQKNLGILREKIFC